MLNRLGVTGIAGLLIMIAGFGVVTYYKWQVGVGLALILLGTGLVVRALVRNVVSAFGLG